MRTNQKPGRPINSVVVPTDFSPGSAEAVARATATARQLNATLTILHVIDINPPATRTHAGTAADLMRQLWATAAAELLALKESLERNQSRAQTLIVEGLPAEAIVEHSSDFDLLVIAAPRLTSVWNFFSKQTARRVIEQAQCPVLVVHEGGPPPNRAHRMTCGSRCGGFGFSGFTLF